MKLISEKRKKAVARMKMIRARRASFFRFSGGFCLGILSGACTAPILGRGGTLRNRPFRAPAALALLLALAPAACSKADAPPPPAGGTPRAAGEALDGQALFKAHCMRCHGEAGRGTDQGPPLVNRIYEPGHHPDAAFYRAVAAGVRAHHWRFGDMPRVGGLSNAEVTAIIGYVRGLQREAGIF